MLRPVRHRATALVALTALVAAASAAAATGGLPSPGSRLTPGYRAAVEALARQLRVNGAPLDGSTCSITTGVVGGASSTQSCADSVDEAAAAAAPPAESGSRVTISKTGALNTAAGYIATLPMSGLGDGVVAHVHSYGAVGVTRLDGTPVWSRTDVSFVHEVSTLRAYMVPFVFMGRDPLDPTMPVGEHPFAVADLTGDGVSDVAVAHYVSRLAEPTRATVDVLDGTSGRTVWKGMYSGRVTELTTVGNVLVVAQETGEPAQISNGVAGERSSLHGVRFVATPASEPGPGAGHGQGHEHSGGHGQGGRPGSPGSLTVTPAWSYSTGASAARWLSLTAAGSSVAAAGSATPVGTSEGDRGTVVVLDAASGAEHWKTATADYPRMVRHDAGRGQVVVVEQTDMFSPAGLSYRVAPYALATGLPGTAVDFPNAVPLQLVVDDVAGDAAAEWVLSDVQIAPGFGACPTVDVCASTAGLQVANRVAAYAPGGDALWERSYPAAGGDSLPHPMAYGLAVVPRSAGRAVVATAFTPGGVDQTISTYDGAAGTDLWSQTGPSLAFPLYVAPAVVGGASAVLTASSRVGLYGARVGTPVNQLTLDAVQAVEPYQVLTARAVDDGRVLGRAALLGDIRSAVAVPVAGDATPDVVVGTDSGSVVALDGATLGSAVPATLWRVVLPTQVHEVRLGDVDADGVREVVVTAAHSVSVLDSRTGATRWQVAYPDSFQWTTAVGDVDSNGDDDLVVPSSSLTAYDGRSGAPLWSYTPSGIDRYGFGTPAIAEGAVAAQYVAAVGVALTAAGFGTEPTSRSENDVLLDGKTGAVRWTHTQPSSDGVPALWRATVLARDVAGVSGLAAAFAWDSTAADGFSHPTVDVYDAATGELAVSVTGQGVGTHAVTTVGPYVQVLSHHTGIGIGADGVGVHNLENRNALSGGSAVVGGREYLLVAPFGGRLDVVAPSELAHPRATVSGFFSAPDSAGGLHIGDLDGNGSDDAMLSSFNWDGYGTAQLAGGRFSFAQSVAPRALTFLLVSPA